MLATTFSVSTPIHQCPKCGWPVEQFAEPVEIINLPVIVRHGVIRALAEHVARRRGNVTAAEIMEGRGPHRIAHARHEVIWMARELKNSDGSYRFTLHMIGAAFMKDEGRGGLDHTSVLNGWRRHGKVVRDEALAKVAADNAASARVHGVGA